MANTKSAKKHIEINRRNRLRNLHYKTRMKNVLKKARTAILSAEVGDDAAKEALRGAQSALLSTASKGVIHKNTASRKISRLTQLFRKARVEKTEQLVEVAQRATDVEMPTATAEQIVEIKTASVESSKSTVQDSPASEPEQA